VRDDRERLLDVLEAIGQIEKYAAEGREAFDENELIQTWILHHLRILGEACRALSSGFRDAHPEVPWSEIVAFRHILVHRYFGIDTGVVWAIVENDLPNLKREVEGVLRELKEGP
jgi:uncharacterized protein with HEPN domain